MKLVDQWHAIEAELPEGWEEVRLTLTTEQPGDLPRAAQVLGPINAGKVGSTLVFDVRRAAGPQGAQTVTRLFGRLDDERTWCTIAQSEVRVATAPDVGRRPCCSAREAVGGGELGHGAGAVALRLDRPSLRARDRVEHAARPDGAPLRAAQSVPLGSRLVFTFRCSGRSGYGASRSMARRCFERLDHDGIPGTTRVLRVLSDTDNVDTQGPVWLVGGKTL